MVGPTAHMFAWRECISEFLQAAYAVCRFGLGLIATIRLYNLYCLSTFLYIAHFYDYAKDIVHEQERALLIIQAGPA
jgi:hypothetical protein